MRPLTHVVLVTLDGVRWQDVFEGTSAGLAAAQQVRPSSGAELMPTLHQLGRGGVLLGGSEHPMVASGPNFISQPGYTEIVSGRASRCTTNHCDQIREVTLLDEQARRSGSGSVALLASWERLSLVASPTPGALVISAGRSARSSSEQLQKHPEVARWLTAGQLASPFPGKGDYRPDRFTAPLALAYLRAARPQLLMVSLGDTDEHAHHGNYVAYLESLRAADRFLSDVVSELRQLQHEGHSVVLAVTTDHGRAANFRDHGAEFPESSRVWALLWGSHVAGRPRASGPLRLADLAPTLREQLSLPSDPWVTAGRSLLPRDGARDRLAAVEAAAD